MGNTIIHVDMDAFYAAVEILENPGLVGVPLIIGALPHERGVVCTCSYEARKFGVRSAMNIKEAYRRCPDGVYMHPNPQKYKDASDRIRRIWLTYTDLLEFVSLDEGFLDVTGSAAQFGGARAIGLEVKKRTREETGLTCSVGIGYSMMSAKLASEEKKPDGFFEINDADSLKALIMDRSARVIYGVGPKTAEILQRAGINTVRDILRDKQTVVGLLGNQGRQVTELAEGIDDRRVTPHYEAVAKSISREQTFQQDTSDFSCLKDALRLIARDLSLQTRLEGSFARTVTLKVKYGNMKLITRSKTGSPTNQAKEIYEIAAALLDKVDKRPIRLVGIGLSGFSDSDLRQMTIDDLFNQSQRKDELDRTLLELQRRYGGDVIKTGNEIIAEKRFNKTK